MTYDIRAKRDPKNSTRQQGAIYRDEARHIDDTPEFHRRKSQFTNPVTLKNPIEAPKYATKRSPR